MIVVHSYIHPKGTIARKIVSFFLLFLSLEFHVTADAGKNTRKETESKTCEVITEQ